MTTLAELVLQTPAATDGIAVDLDYGGGGFRAVVQIADPAAGSSVEWHDISGMVSDIRWKIGGTEPRGAAQAQTSTLMLWARDDRYAPTNDDTSAMFGVHVPMRAGLIIRFGVFRVIGSTVSLWWPQFTHRVRRWGDASSALGKIRYHRIDAVDLAASLAYRPSLDQIEEGHRDRIDNLITDSAWPFGIDIYGVDTSDGATPALTYLARDAQASTMAELRAACRPAGLVVRSQKNGKLIIHPAPRDTWNAFMLSGVGATGAVRTNPIFGYYPASVMFTYSPVVLGEVGFWPEVQGSSFGLESDWEHVVNELTVRTPTGPYSYDDPVSAAAYGVRPLPEETWLSANDQAVDDIVDERAYTDLVATPVRFGAELQGGFPAIALLDHLDPVQIIHTSRIGRSVVTVSGQVRSIDHEFKALGGSDALRKVRWRASLQADIDASASSDPLLPVEDLAVVSTTDSSALFSWTNPTQTVTPTATQIRLTEIDAWITIEYPSTGIEWLGLNAATAYRFEVRLIREVDGAIVAVSPVSAISFATDVGVDPPDFPAPDPGCTLDVKLESSPDATTWTVELTEIDYPFTTDEETGVSTYDPPDFTYDETLLYRWCIRTVCGATTSAWSCGTPFIGVCVAPAILADPPYDDAIAFIPKVCGEEVREAISDTVGATGTAFGGFGVDSDGNVALTSAAEGTVAYGLAAQLVDIRESNASIQITVNLGTSPVGIVKLFTAGGLELQASDNGAGWSVAGRVLKEDGGSTTITDTTVLALNTEYVVTFTHNTVGGELELRVDGETIETGTYVGDRRAFLDAWSIALSDNSYAANAAVFAAAVAPTDPISTNLLAWWDLSHGPSVTTSGSTVTAIDDRSANSNTWTTRTGAPQLGTLGGLNTVVFDGVDDGFEETTPFMEVAATDGGAGITIYAVVQIDNDGGAENKTVLGEYLHTSGTPLFLPIATGTGQVQRMFLRGATGTTRDLQAGGDIMDGTWRVLVADISSTATAIYQGTTLIDSDGGRSDISISRRTLGKAAASGYTKCAVAEILVYDEVHDATERGIIVSYLTAKWGL